MDYSRAVRLSSSDLLAWATGSNSTISAVSFSDSCSHGDSLSAPYWERGQIGSQAVVSASWGMAWRELHSFYDERRILLMMLLRTLSEQKGTDFDHRTWNMLGQPQLNAPEALGAYATYVRDIASAEVLDKAFETQQGKWVGAMALRAGLRRSPHWVLLHESHRGLPWATGTHCQIFQHARWRIRIMFSTRRPHATVRFHDGWRIGYTDPNALNVSSRHDSRSRQASLLFTCWMPVADGVDVSHLPLTSRELAWEPGTAPSSAPGSESAVRRVVLPD